MNTPDERAGSNSRPDDAPPPPSPPPGQDGPGDGGKAGDADNPYARQARAAADKARIAAQDAFALLRGLLSSPMTGIAPAHAGLDQQRILGVAIVFALVAAIGLALAAGIVSRAVIGALVGTFGFVSGFHFGSFLKLVLIWLLTIAGAGLGVRLLSPLFGGGASFPSSFFVVASAYLPLGVAALVSALVGAIARNQLGAMLVGVLMIFGFTYLVLTLNAGLRHVAAIDERQAAPATACVVAVACAVGWLVARLLS